MRSAVVFVDPETFQPGVADPANAYHRGQYLMALETWDCDGDGQLGMTPFEVTGTQMTGNGSELQINHNPGSGDLDLNLPGGFNYEVNPECAIIGSFQVVQYRVNPLPPANRPSLERRDIGQPWTPLAADIENLQFQYAAGANPDFLDEPAQPDPNNPTTWITRVRLTITARTESTNLPGSSEGVFAAEDTHIRKTFSTVVNLRNITFAAQNLNYLPPETEGS
jgi:hypothetical protein